MPTKGVDMYVRLLPTCRRPVGTRSRFTQRSSVGFRTSSGEYYVCGSQPYRRGMGCGPGVYVPRRAVEGEVCQGLGELLRVCADPGGFTRQVNMELRRLWQESTGYADSVTARTEVQRVKAKIANIRRAIEEGLADAPWANSCLRELSAERDALTAALNAPGPRLILRS